MRFAANVDERQVNDGQALPAVIPATDNSAAAIETPAAIKDLAVLVSEEDGSKHMVNKLSLLVMIAQPLMGEGY